MDKLDKAIASQRKVVEAAEDAVRAAEQALAIAKVQLRAFEEAARLRPANGEDRPRRGRQPGAISADWRRVLHKIFVKGAVDYATIHQIANDTGIDTDLGNVRDRVRAFIKAGLMEGSVDDGFEVTDEAAQRFDFAMPQEEPLEDEDEMWSAIEDDEGDDEDAAYERSYQRHMDDERS